MIKVRKADEIYAKDGGWFHAKWHFSFDDYHDPQNMGFGTMRVFNDDTLVPGAVWPMHPHRDIEGLTYVPSGTFRHEDNLGNLYTMPAGSVQRMTLGSGAYHSEQNGSATEPLRFIQIWNIPRETGLAPGAESRPPTAAERTNRPPPRIGPRRDGRSPHAPRAGEAQRARRHVRIRVDLRIEDEHFDGFARHQHARKVLEADVVHGAVAADGHNRGTEPVFFFAELLPIEVGKKVPMLFLVVLPVEFEFSHSDAPKPLGHFDHVALENTHRHGGRILKEVADPGERIGAVRIGRTPHGSAAGGVDHAEARAALLVQSGRVLPFEVLELCEKLGEPLEPRGGDWWRSLLVV